MFCNVNTKKAKINISKENVKKKRLCPSNFLISYSHFEISISKWNDQENSSTFFFTNHFINNFTNSIINSTHSEL